MHKHECIKCKTQYHDSDPEPFLCASCEKEKNRIAEQVDRQMAARPQAKTKSALEEYDEAPKFKGFMIWKP